MKTILYLTMGLLLVQCSGNTSKTENTAVQETADVEQWLTFEGKADMPNIVLVSGDEEYRSEEALPMLAKILNTRHGFNCTVLFAQDPEEPGIVNPNYLENITGLDQLESADLMILFTRFRSLPDEQMKYIDNYLMAGKPVLAIRTSTHGFLYEEDMETSYAHYSNGYEEEGPWKDGFGRLVMGEMWISHHGHHRHQSTRGLTAAGAEGHPVLTGISDGEIWGPTDVYGVRLPLPGDSQPIVLGQVINRAGEYDEDDPLYGMRITDNEIAGPNMEEEEEEDRYDPNNPMMPVAWSKSYQLPGGEQGTTFATTIGASTDLVTEGTRRMMVNAAYWLLDMEVPAKANVDIVGNYDPSPYAFYDEDYWIEKNLSVSSLK